MAWKQYDEKRVNSTDTSLWRGHVYLRASIYPSTEIPSSARSGSGSGTANGVPVSIEVARLGRAGPGGNVLRLVPSEDTLAVLALLALPCLLLPCLERLGLAPPCLERLCLGFPARGPSVLYMFLTTVAGAEKACQMTIPRGNITLHVYVVMSSHDITS